MLKTLRQLVCQANWELKKQHLVLYSWGNVSGIDRDRGLIAIKPSGVAYDDLTPELIVLVNVNGRVVEGNLKPSSDTPTHLELYRSFPAIGGICHTHSRYATMWAQACRELPCLGTTHADSFHGPVPVTAELTAWQLADYELNTGKVIAERFCDLDPMRIPAVLAANHGPFTWGETPAKAAENAVVLEEIACMALGTLLLNAEQRAISRDLLEKHYGRKHGPGAYYGQSECQHNDR